MKANQQKPSKPTFVKFMWSLWRPVRFATLLVLLAMTATEVFRLLRQYVLKDIIDLPLRDDFQFTDLYLSVVLFLIFYAMDIAAKYSGVMTRQIHIYKKQTPYVTQVLFQQVSQKNIIFSVIITAERLHLQ